MARKKRKSYVKATPQEIINYMQRHRVRATMCRRAARRFGTRATARALGISAAHISNIKDRGISGELNAALERHGLIKQRPLRHGAYYHAGYGAAGAAKLDELKQMLDAAGGMSLTEFIDQLVADWQQGNDPNVYKILIDSICEPIETCGVDPYTVKALAEDIEAQGSAGPLFAALDQVAARAARYVHNVKYLEAAQKIARLENADI